jgi:hypothetical protein
MVQCKVLACSDDDFKALVAKHTTRRDIIHELGLATGQGYYNRLINARVQALGLDTSHWVGSKHPAGKFKRTSTLPIEAITNRADLKRRLIRDGVLENKCSKCGIGPEWQGEPLSLQLDHIDGNRHNNARENLRLLCPNCHSQTPTFGSKRAKKVYTCDCGTRISRRSQKCPACEHHRRKGTDVRAAWPSPDTLLDRLRTMSVDAVGRDLGVSGAAVKKHLTKLGLWAPRKMVRLAPIPG